MKKKRQVNHAMYLIKQFGGIRPTAYAVGRAPSAVHRWTVNRAIPKNIRLHVLQVAEKSGINISKITMSFLQK